MWLFSFLKIVEDTSHLLMKKVIQKYLESYGKEVDQ